MRLLNLETIFHIFGCYCINISVIFSGEYIWFNTFNTSSNNLFNIGNLNGTFQLRFRSSVVGSFQSPDFQIRNDRSQLSTSAEIVDVVDIHLTFIFICTM